MTKTCGIPLSSLLFLPKDEYRNDLLIEVVLIRPDMIELGLVAQLVRARA